MFVYKQVTPDAVTYGYSVLNEREQPITALHIGNEQVQGLQLRVLPLGFNLNELTIPATTISAPRGWTANIVLAEDSDKHGLRWLAPSRTDAILSGEQVGWFTIKLPVEDPAHYAGGLFQVALGGAGYAKGYLEAVEPPGVDMAARAITIASPHGDRTF
ncbi:MAG: hypothetical protein AB7H81_12380 [Vicinamibacterales bacterium]